MTSHSHSTEDHKDTTTIVPPTDNNYTLPNYYHLSSTTSSSSDDNNNSSSRRSGRVIEDDKVTTEAPISLIDENALLKAVLPPAKHHRLDQGLKQLIYLLEHRGTKGQLLLLICDDVCYRERGQTIRWLREYVDTYEGSTDQTSENKTRRLQPAEQIRYHYYRWHNDSGIPLPRGNQKEEEEEEDENRLQRFEKTSSRQRQGNRVGRFPSNPRQSRLNTTAISSGTLHHRSLIYVVAGQAYRYPGDVNDEWQFKNWLAGHHQSTSVKVDSQGQVITDILQQVEECDGRKWLLLINNPQFCSVPHWENIVRSLNQTDELRTARLTAKNLLQQQFDHRPEYPTKILVEFRLPQTDIGMDICAQLLLLQNNSYTFYTGDIRRDDPNEIRKFVSDTTNLKCGPAYDTTDGREWHLVQPPLTDVEVEYLREESGLDRLKRKQSYVIIGATGGVAVIVLAISIFWGLNSSSFAVQK